MQFEVIPKVQMSSVHFYQCFLLGGKSQCGRLYPHSCQLRITEHSSLNSPCSPGNCSFRCHAARQTKSIFSSNMSNVHTGPHILPLRIYPHFIGLDKGSVHAPGPERSACRRFRSLRREIDGKESDQSLSRVETVPISGHVAQILMRCSRVS